MDTSGNDAPLGLLGGTFDPIHLGHLRMAEELGEALALTEVRFLPTGTPPHRAQPWASAADRLAMTRLAIAGNPRFKLDEHEIHKTTPCYMVDTLRQLRAELGSERPLILFLGADAFMGLTTWHDWGSLFELAHLAVAHRPGFDPVTWQSNMPAALAQELARRRTEAAADLHSSPAGRIYLQPITQLDIAASRIRSRILGGASIRYLVPDAVLDYIERRHLYRKEP
ncbi:MAG: nicotinate-nucleotide adenylyltransferase [Thiobacillaceae bacterium]